MGNQESSGARESGSEAPRIVEQTDQPKEVEETDVSQPRWREVFHQAFEKARRSQQPVSTRRELGKDKSKSLLVLAGASVVIALLFLAVFSSPNKPNRPESRRPGSADLGRRATPGQQNIEPGKSVTPLLNADLKSDPSQQTGEVTPEEVGRTAKPHGTLTRQEAPPTAPDASKQKNDQYALSQIDFSDPALKQQPGYGTGPAYHQESQATQAPATSEAEQLRKPSLVFVRSVNENANRIGMSTQPSVFHESLAGPDLPPGTRLVARLESPVSTAVKQPVIAVIEYNYERDGEIIIPAGSRAVGQLRQADRNGFVDIKFDSLEMSGAPSEKLDGMAMGLDFKPLKGTVAGKMTGTKFLVRAFTGLGTAASYLVGNGGGTGFSGPLSESALLRERMANNIGIAGDQELNQLAANTNIVVTVPGSTRFYIVLANTAPTNNTSSRPATFTAASTPNDLPSLSELRQLMQLKQELSAMYQQASTQQAPSPTPQQ
jgi:hypothetical protein